MKHKKFPIGIQSFRKIREEGYYYVDKTPQALRLIELANPFFLSRPPRFGKSLFLDMLQELFEGNRALFEGLYAEQHWDWSVRAPVVRLTFGESSYETPQAFVASVHEQLSAIEATHNLPAADHKDLSWRFKGLLRELHQRTGQRVVLLIDDYDRPILLHMAQPDLARRIHHGLVGLLSIIKGSGTHLRFLLMTGITTMWRSGIFSGLNHLNDITLSRESSAICGFTERDLDEVFAAELEGVDRAALRRGCNGYDWGGDALYHPSALLHFLQERGLSSAWFDRGTTALAAELLARGRFFTPELSRLHASYLMLSHFDLDHIEPEALLWRMGCLTFHEVRESVRGQHFYTLGYPNGGVERALNEALLPHLGVPARSSAGVDLEQALRKGDMAAVEAAIRELFASLPPDGDRERSRDGDEGHATSVFYSQLAALGLDTHVEDAPNPGCVDLSLRLEDRAYVFGFQVVGGGREGSALSRLHERGYAMRQHAPGRNVTLVGVEFGKAARNVVGFEVAEVPGQGG